MVIFRYTQPLRQNRGTQLRLSGACRRASGANLDPKDLSRVHDVIGVDRLLDRAHDAHRLAVFGDQELYLATADAVLAGAGTVEGQRPTDQPLVEALRLRQFSRVVWVEDDHQVEVTVTDMADNRRWQEGGGDIPLRRDNAFGQPRNRYTDIGCQNLPTRAQRPVGINDVMPCPPQLAALLRLGRPGEICAAMGERDFLNHLRLLRHADLRAVEFEPQRWCDRQVEF
jgi:hypothetical protein